MNSATTMKKDQEFRGFRKLLIEVLRAAVFITHPGNYDQS